MKEELAKLEADLQQERAWFQSKLDEAQRESQKLLRMHIAGMFDAADIETVATELKERIATARSNRDSTPQISVDEIDFDGVRESLSKSFELVRDRIPFIPTNDDERELIFALRRGVKGIVISHSGMPPGRFRITITMQWERYFLTSEVIEHFGFASEVIETEFFIPPHYESHYGSLKEFFDLASQGFHALTDAQWHLVERDLPDLTVRRRSQYGFDTRSIVHCLLFITRLGLPLFKPPPFFGPRKAVYNALERLIIGGGIEILVSQLGKADPSWLEGLNFDRFKRIRRCPRTYGQPPIMAVRLAEDGRYDLSDAQFDAVKHLFGAGLVGPDGWQPSLRDMRTALNAILIKLRSGCGWRNMPSLGIENRELSKLVFRICYRGIWTKAHDIWSSTFPEVVAGLSTAGIQNMMRETLQNYRSARRRHRIGRSRAELGA